MIISVIIPVRNGAMTLERCLESIINQTISNRIEIIVLDTMSTDKSPQIALSYGARIVNVPESAFDHGLTRNLGVSHARGALIYFTVQDAWIPNPHMLETMAKHFENGSQVVAVCGHQAVPHETDKNPMLWYRPVSKPAVSVKQIKTSSWLKQQSQEQQKGIISWDNVVAMYKKSALDALPFVQTQFAEDWVWNYQAMVKGWKTLHDSSLLVYHYHHQSFGFTFRTSYSINYHFLRFFNFTPTIPNVVTPTVRAIYHLLLNQEISAFEKLYWIKYNFLVSLANLLSVLDFLIRLRLGFYYSIEKGFKKYCKAIPQGKQKARIKSGASINSLNRVGRTCIY